MHRFILISVLLTALMPASALPDSGSAFSSTTLTRSSTGWDGKPFSYPAGEPEITMARMHLPAGHALPWHCHPMPVAGYVVSGELEVTAEDGQSTRYTAQSGEIEVFQTWHEGTAIRDSELIVVYAGAREQPLSVFRSDGGDCRQDEEAVIEALLHEFLDGASRGDRDVHDRFWAGDLVYTSSDGTRRGKGEIMAGMGDTPDPDVEPAVIFSAADIDIRRFGSTAVLAFRLLGQTNGSAVPDMQFFNTGTLVKRENRWQVVAWQATRIPEQETAAN